MGGYKFKKFSSFKKKAFSQAKKYRKYYIMFVLLVMVGLSILIIKDINLGKYTNIDSQVNKEQKNTVENINGYSNCKVITKIFPSPTPYDPNNPYSHKVISDGIYIDYIQGYCFEFPKDDFMSIDGWLTSHKSITGSPGNEVFNFDKPHLTISSLAYTIDGEHDKDSFKNVEAIRIPIGAKTDREMLEKISERTNAEFERATFFYKTDIGEYGGTVKYETKWYLPEKNKVIEFELYADQEYEKDLETYQSIYDEIVESFEFF